VATVIYTCTKTLPVVYNASGQNNPGDLHLPIGLWDPGTGLGWLTRALLYAPVSFAGMTSITEARLYLYQHTASGWHAKGSGSVSLDTRRKTVDWSESSGGDSTGTDETWGGSGESLVSSGFTDDGDASGGFNNAAADSTLNYISITELVRAWFAGSPNYGILLFPLASGSADACEFYSRRAAGKVPYIWIDYATNTAPNAPIALSPTGSEIVHTGASVTLSGTRSDPDAGDYITGVQTIVYEDDGVSLVDDTLNTPSGTPTAFGYVRSLGRGNFFYKWKARTRDKANVWGPYSALQRFKANSAPWQMVGPTVDTDTLTPTITGTFGDADLPYGDNIAAVQIHVELAASPYTDKWLTADIVKSAFPWSQVYAGTALSWGVAYRAKYRTKDTNGAYSAWSLYTSFTPVQPTGPDNMTPRTTTTKQNSLTPTLTIGHSALFQNDEIEVRTGPGTGTVMWTKTWDGTDYADVTSKARTYAGTALSWGATYYWRARIELADASIGAWSAWYPFYVNALPTAASVSIESDAGVAATIRPSDGMAITKDSTPVIRAPFTDPDKTPYGDTASARRIELRRADTQAAHTGYPKTTGTGDTDTVGTALTADLTYEVRVGFRDNAAQPAGDYVYSAWKQFRYSLAPSATLTAPASGSNVADATPTLDWAFTSPGGKLQRSYRIEVFDKGPTGANYANEERVHDSGTILSAVSSYDLPIGILADDHDYRWQVTVEDTDGLTFVLV
jgi:hypothetical protein